MRRNKLNRILSFVLSLSMISSDMLPALAADDPSTEPEAVSVVSDDEADEEQEEEADTVTVTDDQPDADTAAVTDDQPDADEVEDEFVFVPGYQAVPGKTKVSVVADGIGYRQIESSLIDDDDDLSYADDHSAELERAYPFSYTQTSELREFLTTKYPPVRDQNPYGTCWAHSAIGLTEFYMINHGLADANIDYSELHLIYYDYFQGTPSIAGDTGDKVIGGGNVLDTGGNLEFAAQTLMRQRGAVLEEDVPYSDANTVINARKGIDKSLERKDAAYIKNAMQISFDNQDLIKEYIMNNGLVGVTINAVNNYYNSTYNSFYCSNTNNTNHAVSAVGWDDDFPASHFNTPAPGNGAWLIRNSWNQPSTDLFSYYEYFWVSYYDTSLTQKNGEIEKCAWTFEMMPKEEFPGNSYYYDSQIHMTITDNYPYSANVYTANGKDDYEKIEAVTFAAEEFASSGTGYEINIYTGVDPQAGPSSGKLQSKATTTGTLSLDGQYTVKLKAPVIVKHGESFAIVVKRKDGKNVGCEYRYGNNQVPVFGSIYYYAGAQSGQSYRSSDGSNWTNEVDNYHGNFILGALTSDVSAEDVDYGSLSVSPTDVTLTYSKPTADLTVTAYKKDGTKDKNPEIVWESSDPKVATVDNGLVTAVDSGKAKITAVYGKYKAECNVTVNIKKVAVPQADKADGSAISANTVIKLSCSTNGASIYYTLDGSDPTKDSEKSDGTVTIGKKFGGKNVTLKLRAYADESRPSEIVTYTYTVDSLSGLKISDKDIVIQRAGESKTITAVVYNDEGEVSENAVIVWDTSDPLTATVDGGVITAVASGNAVISASYGTYKEECNVRILKEHAVYTGLSISPETISFNEAGAESKIDVTVLDQYGDKIDEPVVSFKSSDPAVATVSDNGVVRSVKTGSANIAVKAGSLSADCIVTVKLPQVKTPVADQPQDKVLALSANIAVSCETEGAVIRYTLDGTEPDDSSLSSNGIIAVSPDMAGKTVTLKLRAYAEGYDPSDVAVYVYEVESKEGLVISKEAIELSSLNPKATLTATVYKPDGTVSSDAVIEWSSSDTGVVLVDNGKLESVSSGNAVVTAEGAGYSASCNVTVEIMKAAVPEVENAENSELSIGEEIYIDCATGGAKIYYTTDGTEPSESSASTNGVIKVDKSWAGKSIKLKLRAYAAYYDPSDITEYSFSVEDLSALNISKRKISFTEVGEEETLTAVVYDAAGDVSKNAVVSWNSSDTGVVTVSNGKVTAVASGNAVITASSGSLSANCAVVVKIMTISEASVPCVIELADSEISFKGAGRSKQIMVTVEDQYGLVIKDPVLSFTSSNSRVAKVDDNGVVTSLAGGNTVITVKCGDVSAKCKVSVVLPKAAKPAADKSDGAILEVSSNIIVRCATEGAQIYYTFDGKEPTRRSASANGVIALKDDMAGKIITLKLRAYADGYDASDVVTYTYKVEHDLDEYEPYDPAPDSDEEILIVEFRIDGTEYYTAEVKKGYTLTDLPAEPDSGFVSWIDAESGAVWNPSVPVYSNMILNSRFIDDSYPSAYNTVPDLTAEYLYLVKGQKVQLDSSKIWTWNGTSATVSKKGVLTGKKAGSVTTVSSEDGSVFYYVYVAKPKISGNQTLTVGKTIKLEIDLGAYPDGYPVAWSSSAPAVAMMNGSTVYGVSKGSATITAVVNGKTYKYAVKVNEAGAAKKIDSTTKSIDLAPLQSVSTKIKGVWTSDQPFTNVGDGTSTIYANAVVSITSGGKITAIGSGTTTVYTPKGQKLVITVSKPSERILYLALGKSKTLKFTNVKSKKAKWESSTSAIATVSNKGKITGAAAGVAVVSCTYKLYNIEGSGFTYETRVYVENPDLTQTAGIVRKKTNNYVIDMKKGSATLIRYAQEKNNALYQPVVYKSNKPAVAYVDESGVIHAIGEGKAKLTTKINGKSITITVNVG